MQIFYKLMFKLLNLLSMICINSLFNTLNTEATAIPNAPIGL